MGEGGVMVISQRIPTCYFPLPFIPSHPGRGIYTFYEIIKEENFVF